MLPLLLPLLLLGGCTIEVGPPPESDPPLVPETAKAPPPPPQPTEPQAWSRDLDLDSGPTTLDSQQLAEGLVASDVQGQYSEQRLTFLSAFEEEQKLSEAEQARQRARARAEAAGLPLPPEVSAAPVASVSSESLPAEGTPPRRESRLPPPPKFPPLPPKDVAADGGEPPAAAPGSDAQPPVTQSAEAQDPAAASAQAWEQRQSRLPAPPKFPPLPPQDAAAPEGPAGEAVTEDGAPGMPEEAARMAAVEPEAAAQAAAAENTADAALAPETSAATEAPTEDAWAKRQSRLPAPPKFPPLVAPQQPAAEAEASPADTQVAAVPGTEAASAGPESPPAADPATQAAGFAAEAWDAPSGTILVQVAAVTDAAKVAPEWHRLQSSYPQVLEPLRLVVEPAMLGERAAFYRVQAGGFGSEAGAAAACDVLISAGQACFVVVR